MVRKVVGDAFGELLETGKAAAKQAGQIPGQIVKTAGQQISGKKSGSKTPSPEELKKATAGLEAKQEKGIKELLGKPVPPEKMNQLKQKDVLERNKGLDDVRSKLGVEKIKRYQNLQQKILEEEKKKETEIPEYEAGKTGIRTVEEKIEVIKEQEQEAEEKAKKDQEPLMPSSAQKMPGLDRMTKGKKGTKELGKKKLG